MMYGTRVDIINGKEIRTGRIDLNHNEVEMLEQRKPVEKITGTYEGEFKITVKITKIRR